MAYSRSIDLRGCCESADCAARKRHYARGAKPADVVVAEDVVHNRWLAILRGVQHGPAATEVVQPERSQFGIGPLFFVQRQQSWKSHRALRLSGFDRADIAVEEPKSYVVGRVWSLWTPDPWVCNQPAQRCSREGGRRRSTREHTLEQSIKLGGFVLCAFEPDAWRHHVPDD